MNYQHFYGTKDAGVNRRLIGLSELFTCTFSGPETEEAAKECPLPEEVEPPETPSELNRMTFSGVIHCDAWETPVQHRTVTIEKSSNTGSIKIDLMPNVSYTTNEGSAIYENCESTNKRIL